jgi:hypothetical protein
MPEYAKARLGPGLGVVPLEVFTRCGVAKEGRPCSSVKDNRRLPSGDSLNGPQNNRAVRRNQSGGQGLPYKSCILRYASEAVRGVATTQHNNYLENTMKEAYVYN